MAVIYILHVINVWDMNLWVFGVTALHAECYMYMLFVSYLPNFG